MKQHQVRHYRNCSSINLFGARSKTMSTHHRLKPEPHTRTFKRMSKDGQAKAFYIIPKILHTRTYMNLLYMNIPEDLSNKHQGRASSRSQGPLEEDSNRISTRPSHKDLRKLMPRHLTALHKDLQKLSLQGSLRELHRDLYKISPQGIGKDLGQDLHAKTPNDP